MLSMKTFIAIVGALLLMFGVAVGVDGLTSAQWLYSLLGVLLAMAGVGVLAIANGLRR